MTRYKSNNVLLALIFIGLLASFFVSYERHKIEQANRSVDMLFEYEEILSLAAQAGKSPTEGMALFKESGITSLIVYETTLERLEKKGLVTVLDGGRLLSENRAGLIGDPLWLNLLQSGQIKAEEVYISGILGEDMLDVEEDLGQRLGFERIRVVNEQNPRILAVYSEYESVYEQDLGLLTSDLRAVEGYGFGVIVRPTNYQAVTIENIESVFARLDKAGVQINGMLFSRLESLGYPDLLPEVAKRLNERQITLGMTEHPLQLQFDKMAGLLDLAKEANYQVARLYVIDEKEQEKRLDVPKAVRRWALTDEERNVRMNFLRAFQATSPGKTLLETNLEYVQLVRDGVLKRGFTLGPAGIFEPYFPNKLFLMVIVFGVVAAGVFYLSMLTSLLTKKRQIFLTLLGGGVLSLPFLFTYPTVIRQAVALLAAIIFPVLAMAWQMRNWEKLAERAKEYTLGKVLFTTSWQLAATVCLSLIGGFYISGILTDIRFLLEIEIYRGVKVTFLMPLVLITLLYLKRYTVLGEQMENKNGLIGQLRELLNYPVYLKTLFLIGVGAVIAYIFIGRTGHTAGLPVPGIEVKLRVFLEEVMYARPREKEFLVGHPAFFLAAAAAWRNLPHLVYYCLVIGATIGQGCLVETFAHMRTPVMMSFIRAIDGLLMGGVFGILAFLAACVFLTVAYRLIRRYSFER